MAFLFTFALPTYIPKSAKPLTTSSGQVELKSLSIISYLCLSILADIGYLSVLEDNTITHNN